MKKCHSQVPYLRLVTTPEALATDPPQPAAPDPAELDLAWQVLRHGDDIRAGRYAYWIDHGGAFLPDVELKARGLIPADWSVSKERQAFSTTNEVTP